MPEKTQASRAKQAKKKGTPMVRKATDAGAAYGESAHHAKKSIGNMGTVGFKDRSTSPRSAPGKGLTTKSKKLPVAEGGSSTSRRKTLPTAAAAAYRKDGTPKRTTGRGDTSPLKAGKAYASKSGRMLQTKKREA